MKQEKIKKTKFFVGMTPNKLSKAKLLPATQRKKRVSEGKRASHFLYVCWMPRIFPTTESKYGLLDFLFVSICF
jgi:hypothetical protein